MGANRISTDERIAVSGGEELWVGLCAYCVLAMAKALAPSEGKL